MRIYQREIEFEKEWEAIYKLTNKIRVDVKNNSSDTYACALYDRALYLFDAHVEIEKTNNFSVVIILLRCLFEIKIKASKYQDDQKNHISNTNVEIKKEMKNFLNKIEKGNSFTSQILWSIIKDKKYDLKTIRTNDNIKRKTIKDIARQADLGFDYEILYWLTSLFIHTHPLSLMVEHKENYPSNEILEILSHISRDMDLLNINVFGTMLWISTYLFEEILSENTKEQIDDLWKSCRELISKKFDFEWVVDKNIDLGTMKISREDGTTIELKREQRK